MKKKFKVLLSLVLVLSIVIGGCTDSNIQKTEPQSADVPGNFTYADTIKWDAEYDVVVAGFGAAGAVASKTAAEAGAKVLLLEKTPEGKEGGNSKVCGQFFAYGNGDFETTKKYYQGLAGDKQIDEKVLDAIVNGVANMQDTFINDFGIKEGNFISHNGAPVVGEMSPEYPWVEGSEVMGLWKRTDDDGESLRLYDLFQEHVFKNLDNIDIWFESPAMHLIQDPVSKTIIGVEVHRKGETLNVRALNGVVLATGGFEANEEMVADYLGLGEYAVIGGQYNTGDGIKMAMEVGSDLWHMEVYEGGFFNANLSYNAGIGTPAIAFPNGGTSGSPLVGSAITVGAAGNRYIPEDLFAKHGHYPNNGVWTNPRFPEKSFIVFDQKYMDNLLSIPNQLESFKNDLYSGDTIEELAKNAGIDAEGLKATIEKFNEYSTDGFDKDFGRNAATMTSLSEGPYYAVYVVPSILNTQGGPRKNENGEVLDINGDVIPQLYVAGELGGITSNQYQGGTNIAECITFGKISGANAAKAKESLPDYKPLEQVKSTPMKPGEMTDYSTFTMELAEGEYLGEGNGIGGKLYVKVTMDGEEIKEVEIVKHNETSGISDPAIEKVPVSIVEKQSTEVDTVSGATITSQAIIEAVGDALSKIK